MALRWFETPCGMIEPIANSVTSSIGRWTGDVPYAVQMTDSDWPGYNASGKSWAYRIDAMADHGAPFTDTTLDRWHWFAFTFKIHDTDSGIWMIAKNGYEVGPAYNHIGLCVNDSSGNFYFNLYRWNYNGAAIENSVSLAASGGTYDPTDVHRVVMALMFHDDSGTIKVNCKVYWGSSGTAIIDYANGAPASGKTWLAECAMAPSQAEMVAGKDAGGFGCDYGHFYWCDDTGSDHNVNPLNTYNVCCYPAYADTTDAARDDYVQINTTKGGAKYHQVDDYQDTHDEVNDCVGTELAVEEQMFKMAQIPAGTAEKLSIVTSTYKRFKATGALTTGPHTLARAAVYSYGDGGDDWADYFNYLSISLKFSENPASGYQYVYFQLYGMVLGNNSLQTPDDNATTPDHSDVAPVGAISDYRAPTYYPQLCEVVWNVWDTPDSPIPVAGGVRRWPGAIF